MVAWTLGLKWRTRAQTLFWCSVTLCQPTFLLAKCSSFLYPQYLKCSFHSRTRLTKIWSGFYKQHSSGQLRAVRDITAEKTTLIEDKNIWQEGLTQSDIHDIKVGGTAIWNPWSLAYVIGWRTWTRPRKEKLREILFYHSGADKDATVRELDAVCFDK